MSVGLPGRRLSVAGLLLLATVLGLVPQTRLRASTQNLTLQASFIARNGLSKALLADAQGSRVYVVGEHLPGGSTLRRVSADHVVLWNKGREERLMLQTGGLRRAPRRRYRRFPRVFYARWPGNQSDQVDEAFSPRQYPALFAAFFGLVRRAVS